MSFTMFNITVILKSSLSTMWPGKFNVILYMHPQRYSILHIIFQPKLILHSFFSSLLLASLAYTTGNKMHFMLPCYFTLQLLIFYINNHFYTCTCLRWSIRCLRFPSPDYIPFPYWLLGQVRQTFNGNHKHNAWKLAWFNGHLQ